MEPCVPRAPANVLKVVFHPVMAHAQISRLTARTVGNAAIPYFVLCNVEQLLSDITCSAQAAQHALQVLASAPTVDWV